MLLLALGSYMYLVYANIHTFIGIYTFTAIKNCKLSVVFKYIRVRAFLIAEWAINGKIIQIQIYFCFSKNLATTLIT